MLKRTIALMLATILLLGMLPVAAIAEEEDCSVCHTPKTVRRIEMGGKVQIGQQLLSNGVNVALEYPNNPPAHVDTASEKAAWIAEQCRNKGITDQWEIALWLHDWLIYNANYDYDLNWYTADGVLLYGTGVCDSYTRAYNLLLQQFGIESIRLSSNEMNHAWNLVKIDGQWCHIDVTWDDPNIGGDENHSYFGLTDERMDRDHDWNRSNPNYPPCTSDINYYPIRMGIGFTTEQEINDYLNMQAGKGVEEIEVFYLGDNPDFPFYEVLNSWYQTAYWKYGFTNGYFLINENYAMVCVSYPGSSDDDHVHQYIAIKQEPGCTSEGYTIYFCNKCGDQYTDDYVNALGHTGGTATCADEAVCTRCGKAYGGLDTDNHAGGVVTKNAKKATCTKDGYTGDACCTGCGMKMSSGQILVATGHLDYNKDYTCDICDQDLCTDHKKQIILEKSASCTEEGLTYGEKCQICGEVLLAQQVIPATGHSWKDATCTAPIMCANCGLCVGEAKGHNWTIGSCTVPATCKICGAKEGGTGHTYSHQYDYKCDVCGAERAVDMTRPMVDMFRMYDPNSGEHFYTGSEVEKNNLIAAGWNYEGVGFTFPLTTGKPVYRLYDPVYGEHLYTMDETEKATLMARGWQYEGIAFNSGFENEVPQYRLHNPNASRGAYHFTASIEERNMLIAAGWEYQGIGWYSLGA